MAASGSSADSSVERVNITLRAETRRRLNRARYKRAIQINVSAVCDAAITAELDRLERASAGPAIAKHVEHAEHVARVRAIAARTRARAATFEEDFAEGRDPIVLLRHSVVYADR